MPWGGEVIELARRGGTSSSDFCTVDEGEVSSLPFLMDDASDTSDGSFLTLSQFSNSYITLGIFSVISVTIFHFPLPDWCFEGK